MFNSLLMAVMFSALSLVSLAQSNQTIANLSIRGRIAPSTQLISGFVISGKEPAAVLIRGIGPALAQFGVIGLVARPRLTVYDASGQVIAQNAGWGERPAAEREAMRTVYGAFALPEGSSDSALLMNF